jgi:hypothetical protein
MLWIPSLHLLFQFRISIPPEIGELFSDLDRAVASLSSQPIRQLKTAQQDEIKVYV